MRAKGERHGRAHLTARRVLQLRLLDELYTRRRLARWAGVSESTVTHAINGRTWQCLRAEEGAR